MAPKIIETNTTAPTRMPIQASVARPAALVSPAVGAPPGGEIVVVAFVTVDGEEPTNDEGVGWKDGVGKMTEVGITGGVEEVGGGLQPELE